MGWACIHCGDVNPSATSRCEECGTSQGAETRPTVNLPPVSASLIWVATLLGGVLGGYAVAVWNGRVLGHHSLLRSILYAIVGIAGWILTIVIIANLSPPANANPVEPGFGIPIALALGFLLVSIPYNLDNLSINQWTWAHPARKLVLKIGGGGGGRGLLPRLGYAPFIEAQGELFGNQDTQGATFTIPVVPIVLILTAFVIGVVTLLVGSSFAPHSH